jgi:hypothetical protein
MPTIRLFFAVDDFVELVLMPLAVLASRFRLFSADVFGVSVLDLAVTAQGSIIDWCGSDSPRITVLIYIFFVGRCWPDVLITGIFTTFFVVSFATSCFSTSFVSKFFSPTTSFPTSFFAISFLSGRRWWRPIGSEGKTGDIRSLIVIGFFGKGSLLRMVLTVKTAGFCILLTDEVVMCILCLAQARWNTGRSSHG